MAAQSWDFRRIWSASGCVGLLTEAPTSCHVRPNRPWPDTSPAWVLPEPVATTTGRDLNSGMITLLGQLTRGIGVADCADRGRPTTRQRIWPSLLSTQGIRVVEDGVVELLAGLHDAKEQTRTRSPRKLDVHRCGLGGAGEQQVTVQANRCGSERGRRTEVGRWAASSDEYVGATFDRGTHQVLEGTRLFRPLQTR